MRWHCSAKVGDHSSNSFAIASNSGWIWMVGGSFAHADAVAGRAARPASANSKDRRYVMSPWTSGVMAHRR